MVSANNSANVNGNGNIKGDVEIRFEGTQFVIPEGVNFDQAIEWMRRKKLDAEQEININETIDCHPLEGALAVAKAMKNKYGWISLVGDPTWWGTNPPHLFSFQTGPNEITQIAWGRMEIPGLAGYLHHNVEQKDGRFIFQLTGLIKKKDRKQIADLMNDARRIVREESIYRGKAIRVSFSDTTDKKQFNIEDNCPEFMDLSNVRENELIFNEDIELIVQHNLFTPIEKTKLCRKFGVPLKRGLCLEGEFGVGKTLTAYVAANKCVKNGWTFIYLKNVMQLEKALVFAKKYEPAMIFAEDIDRVIGSSTRTEEIDKILNTIDGVDSKGHEIYVVLTTNDVNSINQAMIRPGRLDTIVSVKAPNAGAVNKLIRLYARGLLKDGIELGRVCQKLDGRIPAVIREVVEKAKLGAIFRLENDTDAIEINEQDLYIAAEGMSNQLKLLEPKPVDNRTQIEKFAHVVGTSIVTAVEKAYNNPELRNAIDANARVVQLPTPTTK